MSDALRIFKQIEEIERERNDLAEALARILFAKGDEIDAAREDAKKLFLKNSALVRIALNVSQRHS